MKGKNLKRLGSFLVLGGIVVTTLTACSTTEVKEEVSNLEESVETASVAEIDLAKWIVEGENTILNFDEEAEQPSEEEIEKMLKAAVKAPTGLNLQHYWYTVVTDYDTQMELATTPETRPTKSTVMFILSLKEDGSEKSLGITMSHLTLAAQGMGYGSHIYGEPAYNLSQEDFLKFNIPEGYTPSEFILVGKSDTVDASSNATPGSRQENWNYYEAK